MSRKYVYLLLFFSLLASILIGEPIYIKDLPIKVYISFDKQSYRLDEDITLKIEVKNRGIDKILIYLSGYKLENFNINILNLKNASLVKKKNKNINSLKKINSEIFAIREIQLYPDETYKIELDLEDYFELQEPGRYKITADFNPYPMNKASDIKFTSNPVYLILKPSLKRQIESEIKKEIKEREDRKVYTPEGMIKFMLDSKIRGDYESYYLYQNLDSIILKYDKFKTNYLKASETKKRDIIKEFKEWDIKRKDMQIEEYEILEVYQSFKDQTATVKCRIKYKPPAIFRTYIYEFYLVKKGIKWILNDFEVLTYLKE